MTVVNLTKGANVNLTKVAALTDATVPLGWKVRTTSGEPFDLDASIFMVTESGKVRGSADFIFYGNEKSQDGSIVHNGDNLVGSNEGDAESITLKLLLVPQDISKLVVAVTIHEAEKRKQNFGGVSGAFIRIVNDADKKEVARYDLTEEASSQTSMLFGEFYRNGTDWKFRAIGEGFNGGLKELCAVHGISANYD